MPWVFEVGTHSAKPVFRTNVSQVHIDAVEIVPDGLCVRNRMRIAFSADGTESTKPRTPNISDGSDLPERKVEEPKKKSIRERVARRRWATNALQAAVADFEWSPWPTLCARCAYSLRTLPSDLPIQRAAPAGMRQREPHPGKVPPL